MQIVINLARDFFLDCANDGTSHRNSPAIITGARATYEIIDTADMSELIGISFHPGGFSPLFLEAADRFCEQNVPLDAIWGARAESLRERLAEVTAPSAKLLLMESLLAEKLPREVQPSPMVEFALTRLNRGPLSLSVHETARQTGWSIRRFSQVFREEVGVSPKTWARIQRFQRAVNLLHGGVEIPWPELALSCGYYDQSHFANDFHGFSGICPTSYCAQTRAWANHVPIA
jgi:AraC-like DNA-binding protein